jgi:hypothetical protein
MVLNVDVFCSLVVQGVFNECKASLAINLHFCGLVMKEVKSMQHCFLLPQFVTPFANKKANPTMDFESLSLCPNLNLISLSKSHSWHLLNIATTNFVFLVGT